MEISQAFHSGYDPAPCTGTVTRADDRALYEIDHRPAIASLSKQLGSPTHVVGAEHHVDVAGLLADELAILLGQAAGDRDLHVGLGVLEPLEVTQLAVELVVGVLTDAARVEHDDVGLVDRAGARVRGRG